MSSVTVKSATATVNYEVFEGDTLVMSFTWKDADGVVIPLSAYSAEIDIRSKASDTTEFLTLTEQSGITLADTAPNLIATLTAAQTATLGAGKFVYDIQLTSPLGVVSTKVKGVLNFKQSVTR